MKKITLLFSLLLAFANSSGQITVGANSGSITSTGYPSPLQDYFKNSRIEILIFQFLNHLVLFIICPF